MDSTDQDTFLPLRVAGMPFIISVDGTCDFWQSIAYRYRPFRSEQICDDALTICIHAGEHALTDTSIQYHITPRRDDDIDLKVYAQSDASHIIEMRHPSLEKPNGWLLMDANLRRASVYISPRGCSAAKAEICNTIIMAAYMLHAAATKIAVIHASCIVKDSMAILFIGKSGAGKSTHSKLWLKSIPGTRLLNDDHPVVRMCDDTLIAYGSPWSGKTDCYINDSAPIKAIVRIKQASADSIKPIDDFEAFVSLFSSLSCLPCFDSCESTRLFIAEALAHRAQNYVISCTDKPSAAALCYESILVKNENEDT